MSGNDPQLSLFALRSDCTMGPGLGRSRVRSEAIIARLRGCHGYAHVFTVTLEIAYILYISDVFNKAT
jgi:hypothetical protein